MTTTDPIRRLTVKAYTGMATASDIDRLVELVRTDERKACAGYATTIPCPCCRDAEAKL